MDKPLRAEETGLAGADLVAKLSEETTGEGRVSQTETKTGPIEHADQLSPIIEASEVDLRNDGTSEGGAHDHDVSIDGVAQDLPTDTTHISEPDSLLKSPVLDGEHLLPQRLLEKPAEIANKRVKISRVVLTQEIYSELLGDHKSERSENTWSSSRARSTATVSEYTPPVIEVARSGPRLVINHSKVH